MAPAAWQRFRRLTLPLLRRVILFAVVVATIYGLQVFDTALILTGGGPGTSTLTIVYRIWNYIFGSTDKVGYGAAISVVLLVAILVLTLIQLRAPARPARGGLTWPRLERGPATRRSRRATGSSARGGASGAAAGDHASGC